MIQTGKTAIPTLHNTSDAHADDTTELTIQFDDLPDTKKQKNAYRATAKDKELAELVHKVNLLCLLARGRVVDNACNDPLIQASLLSLLPLYLQKVSTLEKVTVKDIAPLLRWVHGNFSVRCTPSSEKSFRTSLAFALESRKGTTEELGALAVALFRALNLTTRFVSILDVASLKPGADKDESSGQKTQNTIDQVITKENVGRFYWSFYYYYDFCISASTYNESFPLADMSQRGALKFRHFLNQFILTNLVASTRKEITLQFAWKEVTLLFAWIVRVYNSSFWWLLC